MTGYFFIQFPFLLVVKLKFHLQSTKMHTAKPRMVVPYGLKTLLEGVSRAVLKASPSNITEFAAVYFRELIIFREVEGWAEGTAAATPVPRSKRADVGDAFRSDLDTTPISDEPKRKEKSTDTEEDQINEEPQRELSTKTTQYPSTVDEFVEKAGDEKGAGLAYVPADPAQLAAQMLGNVEMITSEPELKDVAISVQTLPTLSHSAENIAATLAPAPTPEPILAEAAAEEEAEPAPAEAEPEPAPAEAEPEPAPAEAEAEPAPAEAELAPTPAEAEPELAPAASVQSVQVGSATQSQTSAPGEAVTSGSQAELPPADIVEQTSSVPLQEEPPPPAPPPPPDNDPLQAEPCPSEIELTSDIHITPMCDEDPEAGGEPPPPPYVEQFPQQIVIPFVDTVACLLDPLTTSLNAGQFTSILDPSADDAECDPDKVDTTEQLRSADPGFIMSVAIPLEDVMNGKKGSGAGDKAPFAGSYGIAGEITFTTASVRRTE
ncbi:calcium-binding tyrosine phosphorylation-regulated protein isoform X2 [Varanus komodoensis]|uniref:calcium-binding tyrosine phosphorylation-regulated protein isoform X2 n=1 Tax=Varanus komodoensis TaxID=61221 RepID=UPI001CF7A113|nr:calcium-binding tyrosine phosphorylation-regulated protein isoform X2 [Varanus komodoensis]